MITAREASRIGEYHGRTLFTIRRRYKAPKRVAIPRAAGFTSGAERGRPTPARCRRICEHASLFHSVAQRSTATDEPVTVSP